MEEAPASRECRGCKEVKPLTDFREVARYKNGRYTLCRPCDRAYARKRAAQPDVAAKSAERLKAWREANPDKVRKQTAKARAGMSDEQRAKKAAYMRGYWKRTDKKPEYDRRYREAHRAELFAHYRENIEQSRNHVRRRRAKKYANGLFTILPKELRRLYASPCIACGSDGPIHMDHIIPISRGGRHSIGNVQPLCESCNQRKQAKLMVEWKYKTRKIDILYTNAEVAAWL